MTFIWLSISGIFTFSNIYTILLLYYLDGIYMAHYYWDFLDIHLIIKGVHEKPVCFYLVMFTVLDLYTYSNYLQM